MSDLELNYISEPKLTFAYNQKAVDPKDGLMLFGPFGNQNVLGVKNVGVIGPTHLREKMITYFHKLHTNITSIYRSTARPDFPGLDAIFGISINFSNISEIDVDMEKINEHLHNRDPSQRVYNLVDIYISKIIQYTEREETAVDIWFVVIPEDIYLYGRPNSQIPTSDLNVTIGLPKSERESTQLNLFNQNEINDLRKAYQYEVNFHNQLKARLLQSKIITQIIRESKIAYEDYLPEYKIENERKLDTDKAWNIATSLYYKLGGLPWKLGDIREGVCYLGLVFKKIDEHEKNTNACCAAQMFLDNGDGMVFRGNIGPWWNPQSKEFHLQKKDAFEILTKSLSSYYDRFQCYPKEVFIHAKTYFNSVEWSGFEEAASGKSNIVGIRINPHPVFKLYRQDRFAVVRGTMLQYDVNRAFLWTRGFIPKIKTQLGLETPNPLEIAITHGSSSDITTVCTDILSLSKLNYNSCKFGDGLPVTLKFTDLIGNILTAGKDIQTGVLTFKHYI
jgi:hypothetical protein